MRLYLLLLFFIAAFSLSAQEFCVVQDEDGYVNVRDSDNKIIDRLSNGKPVWIYDYPDDNSVWCEIEYSKGGELATGKIHISRLKSLNKFTKIPICETGDNYISLESESTSIKITERAFNIDQHTYQYHENFLSQIDFSRIWGTDGNMPKTEYASFQIAIDGKEVILPKFAFRNLYEPTLDYTEAYYNKENRTLYLTSMNGDGAGGYVVLWLFRNGIFEDRLVTSGF